MPAALLQQVLDVYRQPLRYRALWDDPHYALPEGVGNLLDLANASPEVLANYAEHLYTSGEELAAAIHFFIHQALLAEGRDAYRVLGLTPSASPAQIKSHYRKLMRLYHPDRGMADEWREVYAPRINQAYSRLRHADAGLDKLCVKEVSASSAGMFPSPAFSRRHASPQAGQKAAGASIQRRAHWRKRGLVTSCVAVAVGAGFILWNLSSWPVLTEESPVPSSPVEAMPVAAVNLPPVEFPATLDDMLPAPAKPVDSKVATAGRAAHIEPKPAMRPKGKNHRRHHSPWHRTRRHRAR